MNDSRINLSTITGRINTKALDLLEKHPEGLRWADLLVMIKKSDTNFHPKTINGCVWRLTEKFPDKVYKPSKGLFRLVKYK
jgi:SLT domain-containing protein